MVVSRFYSIFLSVGTQLYMSRTLQSKSFFLRTIHLFIPWIYIKCIINTHNSSITGFPAKAKAHRGTYMIYIIVVNWVLYHGSPFIFNFLAPCTFSIFFCRVSWICLAFLYSLCTWVWLCSNTCIFHSSGFASKPSTWYYSKISNTYDNIQKTMFQIDP